MNFLQRYKLFFVTIHHLSADQARTRRNAGNSGEKFIFLARSLLAANEHEKPKFEPEVVALMRVR
jgi:hypothetical protein